MTIHGLVRGRMLWRARVSGSLSLFDYPRTYSLYRDKERTAVRTRAYSVNGRTEPEQDIVAAVVRQRVCVRLSDDFMHVFEPSLLIFL